MAYVCNALCFVLCVGENIYALNFSDWICSRRAQTENILTFQNEWNRHFQFQ